MVIHQTSFRMLADTPMSAWLVGFLHGLLRSLLLRGCRSLSAGCVAQSKGEEADVRCEGDGARRILDWMFFAVT